jgi:thiol-disulfide isomerase/thioredoxin
MPSHRGSTQPSRRRVVGALLLLGLVACHRAEPPPEGDVAASLTAPSIGARVFDPASLKGKPALVLFVSPTCSHCLAELPHAARAATDASAGLVAVFVAGKAANATGVLESTKFPGIALIDDGTLRSRYDVRRVPYTLVLGADGHARRAFIGEQDEATLRDALADAR